MSHIVISSAMIYYRSVYICHLCGVNRTGEKTSIELLGDCEVENFLKKASPSPHNMPVGWASFYGAERTLFYCEICKHSR